MFRIHFKSSLLLAFMQKYLSLVTPGLFQNLTVIRSLRQMLMTLSSVSGRAFFADQRSERSPCSLDFLETSLPKEHLVGAWNHPWPDMTRFSVSWSSQYDAHGASAMFSVYSFACQLAGFTFVKILVSSGSQHLLEWRS